MPLFADPCGAIKLMRKVRGLSQTQLARLMGCSRVQVSKIERRMRIPTAHTFERYALALEVSPAILATIATARYVGPVTKVAR